MPKLTFKCPLCDKNLVLVREFELGSTIKLNLYKCGHIFSKPVHRINQSDLKLESVDLSNKKLRPYQADGVEFILNSNFNAIIGDQMRLGKTPQALNALKNAYKARTPCLIIVRSANLWQWIREYKTWTSILPNGIFPILGTKAIILPGFDAYIISMDTFSRQAPCKCGHAYHENECKSRKGTCHCRVYSSNGCSILDELKKIAFKLIIVDEAHSFKNTSSNRSQALVDFVKFQNTGEENLVLNFACSRCDHTWIETGKRTYDKRIGHSVISKSSYCPKCQQYCYMQQQHGESDKYVRDPAVFERIEKLLALGNDQSTTEHERSLALVKAKELKAEHAVEEPRAENCGLILLTGTPIKNRAEEYFIPLNLVAPDKFSSIESFRRSWLVQNTKGQWSRINPHRMDAFKNLIEPYVLRREKEDVFQDLPLINRTFTVIEPDKDVWTQQYNRLLEKMEARLVDKTNPTYWDFADDLMQLRRICGMMKTMWIADYLEASLFDSDNQRYAVGLHHESVRDILYLKLGGAENCLKLSGEDNSERKDWVMRNFEHSNQRILLINMIAGGIGMDFHYCKNVLILERGWNSADEEQFEFRFYNPDKVINPLPTFIEYIVAKGTIDEFFFDMVEAKRRIFGETVSNHWSLEQDNGSFKDLIERTVGSRL